jgi:predicted MFS family arabinose efflux permease
LPNAIALNATVNNMARAVGPGIAGFMIGISLSSAFFGKFVFFTAAALSVLPMRLEQSLPAHRSRCSGGTKRRTLSSGHRGLLRLTLFQAIPTLLVYPYLQLVPLMAKNYLHVGSQGYGWLQTGVGIGALIGGIAVARFANVRRKGLIMSIALVAYMSMILLFSFSRDYYLSLLILIVGGFGFIAFSAFNQMLLQLHVADEYRGRVLALYTMSQGLNPFGSLAMGAVAERYLGTPHAIAAFIIAALVLALFSGLLSRDVRSL